MDILCNYCDLHLDCHNTFGIRAIGLMATSLQRGVSLLNGAWDPALLLLLGQLATAAHISESLTQKPILPIFEVVVNHKCCDLTYSGIVCSIVV